MSKDFSPNYVCAYCGLAGYRSPSKLRKSGNNFCNLDCKNKFQVTKIEKNCFECGVLFLRAPCELKRRLNNFCSKECSDKFKNKKIIVECLVCGVSFEKKLDQVKKYPRHCCSRDCINILIREMKDWGGKRSKLEIAIEEHFKIIFPFMYIRYNKTDIGYELDIYIPCLDLAIELNGPLHYRVIYKKNGVERLKRTQEIDAEKVVKCRELDIELFVIDVSRDRGEKIKAQRILQVENIVRDRINELGYVFKNEQMVMEF